MSVMVIEGAFLFAVLTVYGIIAGIYAEFEGWE